MTLIAVLLGVAFVVAALAGVGHLQRIASAIEAQNRAYGIGGEDAADAADSSEEATS